MTRKRHCLVGRVVNTRATVAMAEYLDAAVERITRDRLAIRSGAGIDRRGTHIFSNYAISYRRGATNRVIEKLQDRREEYLAQERERERAAARTATGATTSTAMTLKRFTDAETDANLDFVYGAGWSAGQALKRAQRAEERRRQLEEYTAWAAANPEEAREKEAAAEAKATKRAGRSGRRSNDHIDYGAYYAGYDAAAGVSIDQQVDTAAPERRRLA